MDFSDIFRMVNLAIGAFMIMGGVGQFFPDIGLKVIIVGIYVILFGAATAILEFQIPPQIAKYASFMFSFIGRGVFYIFIGSIMIGENWYQYVPGTLVGVVGIGYAVLEFVPSIEPPANMRDADAGWGAEQV
ncbi:COPI associated [Patellaria atrata CBS 101060]|uniref:COPI associated n=1 Tax=Patellaria atrata CBS 101060 TaxID=1346257 RepID=A0A9P4S1I2_9PEZI|nr:COPI associated [Patellaria atrata CBS 101060]